MPPSNTGVVHGFANHVPLAVALREILPPGYGFSIDPSVDLGVLVSFSGGKPWRDTLKEALEPAGLVMQEQAQMVTISYASPVKSANIAPPVSEPPIVQPSSPPPTPLSVQPQLKPEPKPESTSHFLSLPPSMLPAPNPSLPPVVISGSSRGAVPAGETYSKSVIESWDAERGDSLRKVLERWAHRADVEINWMAEYDYPLQATVHLTGTFEDAVRNLLTGFETAHPQPVAELHSNSRMGQTVLVVTTRGNVGE